MPKAAVKHAQGVKGTRAKGRPREVNFQSAKLKDLLTIAEERGLLSGTRTQVVRGRMPAGLVAEAKQRSGISSHSKLLEAALANLALEDDYGAWLVAQSGTVDPDLDLEF
jgi:hypothetical protein